MVVDSRSDGFGSNCSMSLADFEIYTPGMELSLILSHFFWGVFSICILCCKLKKITTSLLSCSDTHYCWVDRGDMI